MKINIASSGGRSHLLDLAKELEKYGHKVRFYSYVPNKRAKRYGLKTENNKSYFTIAIPFLILLKITKRAHWSLFLYHYFFDLLTAFVMKPCDIFIGHSPMHVYSLKYAKRKYNAKIILERGTSHVLEQIKVLKQNPVFKSKNPMPNMFLKRDLIGYEIADFISVASEHVSNSFLKNNIQTRKIFVNPYGVNLSEFYPTKFDDVNSYDLIMVGQWCHRKGCDLLIELCKKNKNITLLHVGSLVDVEFPKMNNMTHIDAVDQKELINYYKRAKIFILPSREEGLALVQPQAVICGLPIICSKYTGGRDLRAFINDPKWIIELNELTVDELVFCIQKGLDLFKTQTGLRSYAIDVQENLSWVSYGKRYNQFLENL